MDCIFCKITKKEKEAKIIYEDEKVMAILDINPVSPGHTFIIPKEHFSSVLELEESYVIPFFNGIKEVERMLVNAFHPDGFTLGINQGKSAGQGIDHLHFHIIPRFLNDKGGSLHNVVYNPPQESLDVIYEKILKSNNKI